MEVMHVISLCLNYFSFYCGLLLFFLRCSPPVAYRRIERPMFSWISNSSFIIAIKRKNSFSISFSIVCLFLQSSRLLDNVNKSSKSEVMQKQKSSRLFVSLQKYLILFYLLSCQNSCLSFVFYSSFSDAALPSPTEELSDPCLAEFPTAPLLLRSKGRTLSQSHSLSFVFFYNLLGYLTMWISPLNQR